MFDDEKDSTFSSDDARSSQPILQAIKRAEKVFRDWQNTCDEIDDVYSLLGAARENLASTSMRDSRFDLFWASFEILKPAVYARAPAPVVAPMFSDNRPVLNVTGELLERAATSAFARNNIHEVMRELRDDVIFGGRGAPWVRYESEGGKQKVCIEHLDRRDFLHEPARYWHEVGWVARRVWMTRKDMKARFKYLRKDVWDALKFHTPTEDSASRDELRGKCAVWEVWHKADNRVYWVTDGVDRTLDESEPFLDLEGFFPCPKPAYGTLQRRKLVPVPDWERYAVHFRKISELTGRIYTLIDCVRMKGFIPDGGDIGTAVETAMRSNDDSIAIPVPAAALLGSGAAGLVSWLPLGELAQAIQGLIEARRQFIEDFYQLSGISDIMRGATEASETLGAQQLKSQYGSVRVQEKVYELQRVAADLVKIVAEIISEKFSPENMLAMAQMDIPKRKDIDKRIDEIEGAAESELKQLAQKAQEQMMQAQMSGQQIDPQQIEQGMKQAQAQIVGKYADMLAEAQSKVPLEDVIKLLRDERARCFAFNIASDSTVLQDEMAVQAARNDFLTTFANASQALAGIAVQGEAGATLAGEMLKWVLSSHRAGRTLSTAIDAFVKQAPQIAAQQGEQQGTDDLSAAQMKLAEAEKEKAAAQMAKVQADAAYDQAEMQRKMLELQQKAQSDALKQEQEMLKLQQAAQDSAVKAEEALAKVDLIRAQTIKALADAKVTVDNQALDEFKSLADIEFREADMQQREIDREVAQVNRQEDRADNFAMQESEGGE